MCTGGTRGLPLARHGRAKRVLWYKCRSKYNIDDSDERSTAELSVYQDWDKTCAPELGLKMSSRTGIKHVYKLSPGNLAERSKCHGIGAS